MCTHRLAIHHLCIAKRRDFVSELELSVSFPLDSDGFLRRACPTCSREFKWLPGEVGAQSSSPEEYFCPYCGASASPQEWLTEEQQAYIEAEVYEEVVRPSLEDLADSFRRLGKSSGGLIQFNANVELPEPRQAAPVFEPNDMKQVSLTCHPAEPIKVDEAWSGSVHCLYCGRSSDATS